MTTHPQFRYFLQLLVLKSLVQSALYFDPQLLLLHASQVSLPPGNCITLVLYVTCIFFRFQVFRHRQMQYHNTHIHLHLSICTPDLIQAPHALGSVGCIHPRRLVSVPVRLQGATAPIQSMLVTTLEKVQSQLPAECCCWCTGCRATTDQDGKTQHQLAHQ